MLLTGLVVWDLYADCSKSAAFRLAAEAIASPEPSAGRFCFQRILHFSKPAFAVQDFLQEDMPKHLCSTSGSK